MGANYNSLPPLVPVLCSLKDEIAALSEEVAQLRQFNVDNASSNADSACVKHDTSYIKLILRNVSSQEKLERN